MDSVTDQPRLSIVREKHLDDDVNIPKIGRGCNGIFGDVEGISSIRELRVNRILSKKGTICSGVHLYNVTNESGKQLLSVREESSCCCVHCCGPARSYTMVVEDRDGRPLLHFERPPRCDEACWCCCGCALMRMRVTNEHRIALGEVEQRWSLWKDKFTVTDVSGEDELVIHGPCLTCRCLSEMTFEVVSVKGGVTVAEIWKRWKESDDDQLNQDHENFGVTFKHQVEGNSRALLLAAAFLLNHMFFEMS